MRKSFVKSISLVMPQLPLSGITAFVTGWGRCDFTGTELCMPRSSEYFPDEKIDPMLRTISLTITKPNFFCEGYKRQEIKVGVGMFCTGSAREENPAFPCLAVPGAPLVVNAKLAGILSWGFGCGYLHDLPLVYTSTQYYTTWIAQNIVIFRKLAPENLNPLFQATKSYIVLDWLSKTRVSRPVAHTHETNYKELQLTPLDQVLTKLQGISYDIRDYMYEKKFQAKKLLLYEALKDSYRENTTKANKNEDGKSIISVHNEVRPFFNNRSLLDTSIDYTDYNNSDDD